MRDVDSRKRAASLRHRQIKAKALVLDEEPQCPKFAADVMLGRLAKWLRIAGFDVLYSNRYTDDELIALSGREDRVLLSRDTRLLVRKAVRRFIYLESGRIQDQIRQIFNATHTTSLPNLLTRCLACNEVLRELPREEARGCVPPFVFETQRNFKRCPRCRKIYWAGTHRQSVMHRLDALLQKQGAEKSC